ncbi:MAG TPA: NAD(P)-dependent oxidoreductase, partial [Jatrophihabitans sp.]|nr:NAD(P)-dependent oxidoreductase [Jatrophihabitans sp.]
MRRPFRCIGWGRRGAAAGRPRAQHVAVATRSRSMWRRDVSNGAACAMCSWSHIRRACRTDRDAARVISPAVRQDNGAVPGHPLLLDLAGRRVVVVGGGKVATRRARSLVDAGADVLLVAPEVADEL